MPIKCRSEPRGGRTVAHRAFRERALLLDFAGVKVRSAQSARPIPVYLLARKGPDQAFRLASARMAGWLYPIVSGESVHLVSVQKQSDGLKFVGVIQGALGYRLLEAAALAEGALRERKQTFEPRILEIPALRVICLWLCGRAARSLYIPLLEGSLIGTVPLTIERSIAARLATPPAGGPPVAKKRRT